MISELRVEAFDRGWLENLFNSTRPATSSSSNHPQLTDGLSTEMNHYFVLPACEKEAIRLSEIVVS